MVHVVGSKVIHHGHHRVVDGNGWSWIDRGRDCIPHGKTYTL